MSCNGIAIEFPDICFSKELGVFIDGKVLVYSFRPPRKTNPLSKQFGVQETCTEMCGIVDVWITVSFPTFFKRCKE